MEDSWVNIPNNTEHIFLYKKFHEICPVFLSLGMSYDQFWRDDVTITKSYLEAYKIKQDREIEKEEWKIWKQGVYMYEALCDVSPVLHAFAKKGTKPLPYPNKPYDYKEEENKEPTEQEIENERLKAKVFLDNWVRSTRKHFNKEG